MGTALSPACDTVRGQVSLGLDGELSRLEDLMVIRHLERCPDCRAFRDGVTEFTSALRAAPLEHLERPVVIPNARRGQLVAIRGAALRIGAVAASIAVVIGVGLGQRGAPDVQRAPEVTYGGAQNAEMRMIRELSAYRLALSQSQFRAV